MRKQHPRYLPLIFFVLPVIQVIHTSLQQMGIPVSRMTAENLLTAADWNPTGLLSFPDGLFSMLAVRGMGLSPYTGIALSVGMYTLYFILCAVMYRRVRRTNLTAGLLLFALIGLPNGDILCAAQDSLNVAILLMGILLCVCDLIEGQSGVITGIILIPLTAFLTAASPLSVLLCLTAFLLTALLMGKPRHRCLWIPLCAMFLGALIPRMCLGISFPILRWKSRGLLTLNYIQKLFKADFSTKPIMNLLTGRYFLFSLFLLFCAGSVIRTLYRSCVKRSGNLTAVFLSWWICLSVALCALTDATLAPLLICVPALSCLVLITTYEASSLPKISLAEGRLPFPRLLLIFGIFCVLFSLESFSMGRVVTDADRTVIALRQSGITESTCPEADCPLLRLASKGEITFITIE